MRIRIILHYQALGHVIECRDVPNPPPAPPPPHPLHLHCVPRHHLRDQNSRRPSSRLVWCSQAFLWSWQAEHLGRGVQPESRSTKRRRQCTSVKGLARSQISPVVLSFSRAIFFTEVQMLSTRLQTHSHHLQVSLSDRTSCEGRRFSSSSSSRSNSTLEG